MLNSWLINIQISKEQFGEKKALEKENSFRLFIDTINCFILHDNPGDLLRTQ